MWNIPDVHVGQVTDVAFNTFIPFWLASSGEDGVIKLWDIRFLKGEAARIDEHYSSISAISWSNTHCDVISSVSVDRSWKSWGLNSNHETAKAPWKESMVGCPGSEFENEEAATGDNLVIGAKLFGEYNQYDAPVISIATAPTHADTFYTVTALGVVSAHTIRSKVFESQLEHRYENGYERAVETSINNRNLSEAYETMVKLSRTEYARDADLAEHEAQLIEHCTTKPAIDSCSWSIGSKMQCNISQVKQDLQDFCRGLPPRFTDFPQWTSIVPDFIQMQFDLVLLRHKVVTEIKNGNWKVVLEEENKIISGMEVDDEYLDIETIQLIVESTLKHQCLKGMTIGLSIGQLLADLPKFKFDTLSQIMHLLIFPTVYDSFTWIPGNDMELMTQNSATRQEYIVRYLRYINSAEGMRDQPSPRKGSIKPEVMSGSRLKMKVTRGDEEPDAKTPKKLLQAVLGDGKSALPMVSLEM